MTRVLIGEDETLIRLDLRGMLEEVGMEVCAEARDGVEVVELARTTRPELAILDVKMPRLDGIEAGDRDGAGPVRPARRGPGAGRFAGRGARGAEGDRAGEGDPDGGAGSQRAGGIRRLRRASQVSGKPMRVIAEAVIETLV